MIKKYILVGKKVELEQDLMAWASWFETADRKVALTELPNGYRVSTVFLGLDHSYDEGEPLLFETMVFPKEGFNDLDIDCYSTYEQAEEGHKKMVAKWSKQK